MADKIDNFIATPPIDYVATSYYRLRQAIGMLGIVLAPVLYIGAGIFGHCNVGQPSISHYYYSVMHIVFVGTLSVLGAFLVAYRVKNVWENRVSSLAGLFAFGVAAFPTNFDPATVAGADRCQYISLLTQNFKMPFHINVGVIHFVFAGLLFGCFILFCFVFFQQLDEGSHGGIKKDRRNTVYKICGWMILVSIVMIGAITLYDKVHAPEELWPDYIYWLEFTSLVPFGTSWLLKGSGNWKGSRIPLVQKLVGYFR